MTITEGLIIALITSITSILGGFLAARYRYKTAKLETSVAGASQRSDEWQKISSELRQWVDQFRKSQAETAAALDITNKKLTVTEEQMAKMSYEFAVTKEALDQCRIDHLESEKRIFDLEKVILQFKKGTS